jgi:hypothetical protein
MNRNKNISELINLLEIKQVQLIKDAKKNGLKLNALRDILLKDEITFEDAVISKYIVIKTIKVRLNTLKV